MWILNFGFGWSRRTSSFFLNTNFYSNLIGSPEPIISMGVTLTIATSATFINVVDLSTMPSTGLADTSCFLDSGATWSTTASFETFGPSTSTYFTEGVTFTSPSTHTVLTSHSPSTTGVVTYLSPSTQMVTTTL